MKLSNLLKDLFAIFLSLLSIGVNIYFFYQQSIYFTKSDNISYILSSSIFSILFYFSIYSLIKYFQSNIIVFQKNTLNELNEKNKDVHYKKNILQNNYDYFYNNISIINNLSKVSIVLGFLGTLIGLVLGLGLIKTSLDSSNSNDLLLVLNNALSGLFISFNTSIAGILTSISLAYIYAQKSKEFNNFYLQFEKELIEEELNRFYELEDRWAKWEKKFEMNVNDIEKIKTISQDIKTLSEPIIEGVEKLTNSILDTFNDKFKESINIFKETVDSMPNKIENKFNEMIGVVTKDFIAKLDTLKNNYIEYGNSIQRSLNDSLNNYQQELFNLKKSLDLFNSQIDNLKIIINDFPKNVEEKTIESIEKFLIKSTNDRIQLVIDEYRQSINETITPLTNLLKNIDNRLLKTIEEISKKLSDSSQEIINKVRDWQKNLEIYNNSISTNNNNLKDLSILLEQSMKNLSNMNEKIKDSAEFLDSISKSINKLAEVVDFKGINEN